MIGTVLQFADLQELCKPGHKPRARTVVAWCERKHIRFHYDGQGGIWTTTDALNAALGLMPPANDPAGERPQDLI